MTHAGKGTRLYGGRQKGGKTHGKGEATARIKHSHRDIAHSHSPLIALQPGTRAIGAYQNQVRHMHSHLLGFTEVPQSNSRLWPHHSRHYMRPYNDHQCSLADLLIAV